LDAWLVLEINQLSGAAAVICLKKSIPHVRD
jgi:hypothetical protein